MNASVLLLSVASLTAQPSHDVLYDFSAPWCSYCQMMMPVVDKLAAEGLPIVKVNIDQRPDLKQQFGVERIPAFVLVVGGQVQQKMEGYVDENTLRSMLAKIPRRVPETQAIEAPAPRRRSLPLRLADDESKPKWDFHLPLPPFPGTKPKAVQIDAVSDTSGSRPSNMKVRSETPSPSRDVPPADPAAANDEAAESAEARSSADIRGMLSSSVRIRVKDAVGSNFGSGVVIDSAPGRKSWRTIVLTCGHVLRDAQKSDAQIEVDVFNGTRFRTYPGTILKADLDADVGLIVIAVPKAVPTSPVASVEEMVRAGDSVISIGCSDGRLPSVQKLRVTVLNRYKGPDTIECTGVPLQGRSGGGLFTANARVVGVCTNADQLGHRGVYASLKPIHDLLHSAGLDELLPGERQPEHDGKLAEATAPNAEQPPADYTAPSKLEMQLAQVKQRRTRRTSEEPAETLAGELSKDEDASLNTSEDTEVICIIRPVNKPKSASRVVIINRASRKFMAYLTGENKEPALSSIDTERLPIDETASDQTRERSGRRDAGSHVADARTDPTQTTKAWKPSVTPTVIGGTGQLYSPFTMVTDSANDSVAPNKTAAAIASTADAQSIDLQPQAGWRSVRSSR